MNISTKQEHEFYKPKKENNGYEWWYFDAISADKEWSLVVIFYHGNPFSPNYMRSKYGDEPASYPAISISVYRKGKPEFYSFQEYANSYFVWEEEKQEFNCLVGGSSFRKNEIFQEVEYELNLNQLLDSGHSISGKLKFIATRTSPKLINKEESKEKHFWNLLQPKAKVVGNLKIKGKTDDYHIAFHGSGYHDHNVGEEPMGHSFKDWYWGRIHMGRETLLYYVMNGYDGKQHEAWLIDEENQNIASYFEQIELKKPAKTLFGLQYFKEIHLLGIRGDIIVQLKNRVDNGPFYQRFLAEASYAGETEKKSYTGFAEYINPREIENDSFWWMIEMRLRYMRQKPHWVQKTKFLYELTW